jgi:hypothetical protein
LRVTKIGALPLPDPAGLGVNAEAAMALASPALTARNGSLSWWVSALRLFGMMSKTTTAACAFALGAAPVRRRSQTPRTAPGIRKPRMSSPSIETKACQTFGVGL